MKEYSRTKYGDMLNKLCLQLGTFIAKIFCTESKIYDNKA